MKITLTQSSMMVSKGIVDVYGTFVQSAIMDAMHTQYPTPVVLYGVGSFGGSSAFQRLPHRSVSDNARRYGLGTIPTDYICKICSGKTIDICHNIPRSVGGNLTRDNLFLGCATCNRIIRDILTPSLCIALSAYTIDVDISMRAFIAYAD